MPPMRPASSRRFGPERLGLGNELSLLVIKSRQPRPQRRAADLCVANGSREQLQATSLPLAKQALQLGSQLSGKAAASSPNIA
jgi:hypothetical protein